MHTLAWKLKLLKRLSVTVMVGLPISMVLVFVEAFVYGKKDSGPPRTLWIMMVLVLGIALISQWTIKYQQKLNRYLASNDERPYFLCLRSFKLQSHQNITRSGGPVNPSHDAFIVDNVLEELASSLASVGWLLVLGPRHLDPVSEPNVIAIKASDKNWWSLFARIASGCQAVFVIPEVSESLNKELLEISLKATNKTVVIMSPTTGRDNRGLRWEQIRSHLAKQGWNIPKYKNDGMIYLADQTLAPSLSFPIQSNNVRSLQEGLKQILPQLSPAEPICNLMKEIIQVEQAEQGRLFRFLRGGEKRKSA